MTDSEATMMLSSSQRALLASVLDQIVPPEGSRPGAGEAGAADYVDGVLERSPGLRHAFLSGLAALEAPEEGRVTLAERECSGQQLRLNYQTQKEGGWIKVELVEPPVSPPAEVKAIEGFGLEEADVLRGDEVSAPVTWNGNADLSALKGRTISIRIRMARAKVFSTAM